MQWEGCSDQVGCSGKGLAAIKMDVAIKVVTAIKVVAMGKVVAAIKRVLVIKVVAAKPLPVIPGRRWVAPCEYIISGASPPCFNRTGICTYSSTA